MKNEWKRFLHTGDQWILNYCLPPISAQLAAVKLFSIGHAFEIYLKATYASLTGSPGRAIKFGHKIKLLFDECQKLDSCFLKDYEIKQSILSVNSQIWFSEEFERQIQGDIRHYSLHSELYWVAKFLADSKYLGAPHKNSDGPVGVIYMLYNPYWSELFYQIRKYLNFPGENCHDELASSLLDPAFDEQGFTFLRSVMRNKQ